MPGWGKLVAGAVIGAAGTLYATNEEFRRQLPGKALELPGAVRRRFETATAVAREASARRRAEILQELEAHGGRHLERGLPPAEEDAPPETSRYPEEPSTRKEDL